MATAAEKQKFVTKLYELEQACYQAAQNGALTSDQQRIFAVAVNYLSSDIGKAQNRDLSGAPSTLIDDAVIEIDEAISATNFAQDNASVNVAAKELWDANQAIDRVFGEF